MRKHLSLLHFVMPLLLLFAQQRVFDHEFWHVGEAFRQVQSPHHPIPDHKACEQCVVLAHIAGAVHSEAPPLPIAVGEYGAPSSPDATSIAADVPSPRSRGPPLFL